MYWRTGLYYITLIIIILIILNCLWGALRSTKKSLFVIAATAITGIFTMLLAKPFALLFHKPFLKLILSFVPENINEPILSELVSLFLKPLLTVAFYIPLFVIIYLLMKIPVVLLSKNSQVRETSAGSDDDVSQEGFSLKESSLSIAVSGANCLLFFFLLLLPFSGLCTSLSEDVETVQRAKSENTLVRNFISAAGHFEAKIETTVDDPLLSFYSKLGGEKLYLTYAKVKRNGTKSNLHEEAMHLCTIFHNAAPIVTDTRLKFNTETAEGIRSMKNTLMSSEFFMDILYDILDEASSKWVKDEQYMGVVPEDFFKGSGSEDVSNRLVEVVISYLDGASDKEKESLINAFAGGVELVAETGIMEAERYDSGSFEIAEISNSRVFSKLILSVDENTSDLVAEIIDIFSENNEGHILALLVRNMGSVADEDAEAEGELIYKCFDRIFQLSEMRKSTDLNKVAILLEEIMEFVAVSKVAAPAVHEISLEAFPLDLPKYDEYDKMTLMSLLDEYMSQLSSESALKKGTTYEDVLTIMTFK